MPEFTNAMQKLLAVTSIAKSLGIDLHRLQSHVNNIGPKVEHLLRTELGEKGGRTAVVIAGLIYLKLIYQQFDDEKAEHDPMFVAKNLLPELLNMVALIESEDH